MKIQEYSSFTRAAVSRGSSSLPEIAPLRIDERILLVVPHQDDEALACSGLMQHAVSLGIPFRIIVATDGAKWGAWMRARRKKELLRAAAFAGVSSSMIDFLNYPDGSLSKQDGLVHSLCAQIEEFQPTRIITTDPLDIHADHAVLGTLILNCPTLPKSIERIYGVLVHYPRFPRPIVRRQNAPLLPPKSLLKPGMPHWETYYLTKEERAIKKKAIYSYKSQGAHIPAVGWLLRSFNRPNELFRVIR